ncbi:hypothetical protein L218DRAFT_947053 [Marasmius fiardii PR-910]|nr:hypothetical protein L218DRAFT_947053 [Marasmius fiardii PR-910]
MEFMPPEIPLQRLPSDWKFWEILPDEAVMRRLTPGDKVGLLEEEAMPQIPISHLLRDDNPALSRYIQTLTSDDPIIIPTVQSILCSRFHGTWVCMHRSAYPDSDTVLYSWATHVALRSESLPSEYSCTAASAAVKLTNTVQASLNLCASILAENIRSHTGSGDEEAFYLTLRQN